MNDLQRSNFQSTGWTDPRVKTLKQLWGTMPASKIAEEMGHGLTRNAVIGKAQRLGLSSPRKPIPPAKDYVPVAKLKALIRKRKRHGAPWSAIGEVIPPVFVDLPRETSPRAVNIMDLREGMCRWVLDDDELLYCGSPACKGRPFCAKHCAISYRQRG